MSDTSCNHTSVGMILVKDGRLLLIERKKFPFGFAPPAGHVDEGETYEDAAGRELAEEVGLKADHLKLLFEKDMPYQCGRIGGAWHHWCVYEVNFSGTPHANEEETRSLIWARKKLFQALYARGQKYSQGLIGEEEWGKKPGLERVWVEIFATVMPQIEDKLK